MDSRATMPNEARKRRAPDHLRAGEIPEPQRMGLDAIIDLAAYDPRLIHAIVVILKNVEIVRHLSRKKLAQTVGVRTEVAVELLNEKGPWMRWARHVTTGKAIGAHQPRIVGRLRDVGSQFLETMGNPSNVAERAELPDESAATR